MNYASCTSTSSTELRPVQGAVQHDLQRSARLHAQGHRDRHAEQRYALFLRRVGLAGGAYRVVRPRGREEPLLRCPARRHVHLQLRLYRQPRDRQRCGLLCWSPAPIGRAKRPTDIKKVFHSETQFGLVGYPHPAVRSQGYGQRYEGPGGLQSAAAVAIPEAAGAAGRAGDRLASLHQGRHEDRRSRSTSNFILQFCPPVEEEKALRAKFATIGIEAGKPFDFDKLSEVHKAEMALGD